MKKPKEKKEKISRKKLKSGKINRVDCDIHNPRSPTTTCSNQRTNPQRVESPTGGARKKKEGEKTFEEKMPNHYKTLKKMDGQEKKKVQTGLASSQNKNLYLYYFGQG